MCDKKNLPWFVMWYDFYLTRVFYPLAKYQGYNYWLIDYLWFYVPPKNISLIWRRHHCRWRAAKFRPTCISALRAFEQGGIFIVPHLLWHGTSVFPVSFEGPPHLVASYGAQGDAENLFPPGSSRGNIRDRNHSACWIKIIPRSKRWGILYLLQSL
jgi:hypothetical protein